MSMVFLSEMPNHDKDHPEFVRGCAICKWQHNASKWRQEFSFRHPTERLASMPGAWGIGCVLCANHMADAGGKDTASSARGGAFARFEVRSLNTLQGSELRRHCEGEYHMDAMKKVMGISSGCQPVSGSPDQEEFMGVATSGRGVPRADKFVWAVTVCHAAGSDEDYRRFCEAADLTSYLSSGYLLTDSGRSTRIKINTAWGAVLNDQHQAYLRKGVRLAFSIDERDQVFVNRVRVTVLVPEVAAHEFVASVIRDYGHGIQECADAAWKSLESMCTWRVGTRSATCMTTGEGDYIDQKLLKHVQDITFAGASDGAEVAVQGIQSLRLSARLPKLRYQFRDRPHTSRSCIRNVLSYMEGKDGGPRLGKGFVL
jgi:hypothetical protein